MFWINRRILDFALTWSMKKFRLVVLLSCVGPALLSCTFLTDFWHTLFPEAESVSDTITPSGGKLTLNNEEGQPLATLEVPAGAVAHDTAVTLGRKSSGYVRMGDIITVYSTAAVFSKPVTLTLDCTGFADSSGLSVSDMGM